MIGSEVLLHLIDHFLAQYNTNSTLKQFFGYNLCPYNAFYDQYIVVIYIIGDRQEVLLHLIDHFLSQYNTNSTLK